MNTHATPARGAQDGAEGSPASVDTPEPPVRLPGRLETALREMASWPSNHTSGQLALVQAYHRQRAALVAIRAVTGETQPRPFTALSLIDQLAREGLL